VIKLVCATGNNV